MWKSRIPAVAAALDPAVQAALKAGAEMIEAEAKARVVVSSGNLRDAIHTEKTDDGFTVIAGDDDAFYGHFVEFGTSSTPARPFLIPAFEARRGQVVATVTAALRKVM